MAEPGHYNGEHYTEWVDTVKALKRDDRLDEAVTLLNGLVGATESENAVNHYGVAPWYYEQLAIIFRKQKDPAAEVAILERYESMEKARGVGASGLAARLRAAKALLMAAEESACEADTPAACPGCGSILNEQPTKSLACPDCGSKIIVRKKDGRILLLTAEQDTHQKAAAGASKHHEKMLQRSNRCGASDAEFDAASVELRERFHTEPDPADVFWALSNKKSIEAVGRGDWNQATNAYREQAEHLVVCRTNG